MPFVFTSATSSFFPRVVYALLLLAAGMANAQTGSDLYRAAVPVAEQSPAEFKRAAAAGMLEVLTRVSGREDVAAQPALREPLANADRYIEQYRYERASDGALLLHAEFASATINTLLRSAGLLGGGATIASRQTVQLRVTGVESFADYTALLGFLSGSGARAVPQLIDGGAVTLSVQADGSAEQLQQRLAVDGRLLPEASTPEGAANALHYRWQRRGG